MDNGYVKELIEIIKSESSLIARGNTTKTGLPTPPGTAMLDISKLSGIIEYKPSEYTFTTYAGTSLMDINQMLQENNQFLPFDPPLAVQGATIGGTVAANLSGPMRYHYGGVRDFILGVQFLNSQGELVRSGGKVVKNAAGFDLPKLMVGSLGSLGTMIELSFKVFPRQKEYLTIKGSFEKISDAVEKLVSLTFSPIELLSLDLVPDEDLFELQLRIGGASELFKTRITQLEKYFPNTEYIQGEEESNFWKAINEFTWVPAESVLIKVPLIPKHLPTLDAFLAGTGTQRRYSSGANIAWIAWSGPTDTLNKRLTELDLVWLSILGSADRVRYGAMKNNTFYQKIKNALDPKSLWVEV
jgi:glycolate oxidase FAD binding subunit